MGSASATPTVAWRFTAQGGFQSSPALTPDGSRLHIGCDDRRLYALDARTGAEVWNVTTGQGILASPAVSPTDGSVVVGSQVGY